MTKKFRFMTGLLAVVLAFVMLSSVAYIAAESDHDCTCVDLSLIHIFRSLNFTVKRWIPRSVKT